MKDNNINETANIMKDNNINKKEKISYALGGFGKNVAYGLVSSYTLFYYNSVLGISATFIGIMLMAARIFDAFNDPFMGVVVAKTKSKHGKYKPWIFFGTLSNALILYAMFTVPESLGTGGVKAYVTITYFLCGITYTMGDIPYWSIIPAVTKAGRQREDMTILARTFAGIGAALPMMVAMTLVAWLGFGTDNAAYKTGFSRLALIIAVVYVITTLIALKYLPKEQHETLNDMASIESMHSDCSTECSSECSTECSSDCSTECSSECSTECSADSCETKATSNDAADADNICNDRSPGDESRSIENQNDESPGHESHSDESPSVKKLLSALIHNDHAIMIAIVIILFNSAIYLTTNVAVYLFRHDVGDTNQYTIFMMISGVVQFLAMVVLYPIFRKYADNRRIFIFACIVGIAGYALMIPLVFISHISMYMLIVQGVAISFANGIAYVLTTVFVADAVDYGEKKTGRRDESVVSSLQTLMVKLASAVAVLIAGIGIDLISLNENAAVQSMSTCIGLRCLFFAPSLMLMAGALVAFLKIR